MPVQQGFDFGRFSVLLKTFFHFRLFKIFHFSEKLFLKIGNLKFLKIQKNFFAPGTFENFRKMRKIKPANIKGLRASEFHENRDNSKTRPEFQPLFKCPYTNHLRHQK